jgi:hypothetical protein
MAGRLAVTLGVPVPKFKNPAVSLKYLRNLSNRMQAVKAI